MDRYSRQVLLPQIGLEGHKRLRAARVLLVGVGALGSSIAEQLARAGIGFIRVADRDVVEPSNLQRQVLFSEADARESAPKALAAARRLREVNSEISIEPHAVDIAADNITSLAADVDLILDGTDNVATRYLINDVAVRLGRPWVYGACVGMEGRVMTIDPAAGGPCLRCIFPDAPAPGELPTCDTAGVLGPVAAIVGACQAIMAIRLLVGDSEGLSGRLLRLDGWGLVTRTADFAHSRQRDCRCCGLESFEFLDAPPQTGAVLCGRQAVQIRPASGSRVDLAALTDRLNRAGAQIRATPVFVRICVPGGDDVSITAFADGRAIVQGTSDLVRAKTLYHRYVGA